jgi:hypothetical protein
VRGIERNQIVAQQKGQVSAEIVEPAKGLHRIALSRNEGLPGIASHGSEMMDLRVTEADFEIDGQTSERKRFSLKRFFQQIHHRVEPPDRKRFFMSGILG